MKNLLPSILIASGIALAAWLLRPTRFLQPVTLISLYDLADHWKQRSNRNRDDPHSPGLFEAGYELELFLTNGRLPR